MDSSFIGGAVVGLVVGFVIMYFYNTRAIKSVQTEIQELFGDTFVEDGPANVVNSTKTDGIQWLVDHQNVRIAHIGNDYFVTIEAKHDNHALDYRLSVQERTTQREVTYVNGVFLYEKVNGIYRNDFLNQELLRGLNNARFWLRDQKGNEDKDLTIIPFLAWDK